MVCSGAGTGCVEVSQFSSNLPVLQVLFTISKEKLINSWKYGLAVLILDVLQVGISFGLVHAFA